MGDHDLDEVMTKADRRDKERGEAIRRSQAKKASRRAKLAFVRTLERREENKRQALARRKIVVVRRSFRPSRQLAAEITAHIDREHTGKITGRTLLEIYDTLARELPGPLDAITVKDAVNYGCHKLWLDAQESKGNDAEPSCCRVPFVTSAG